IGLSGQMHGLVVLDGEQRVLRPAILWNDQRTAAECAEIEERVGLDRLIALTGNRALTGFTAPKLLWLRRHAPEAYARIPHARLHTFCHAVPGTWHAMGVMLSAAGSLAWLRGIVGAGYDALDDEAARWEPGVEGLLFAPYLAGERTPHADPDARGAFVGLSLRHDRGALARAVLEGVAYGLRDSLELLRAVGVSASVGP